MSNHSPITPPPELVMDWCRQRLVTCDPAPIHHYIATQAAHWGADQELEACCEWIVKREEPFDELDLHNARRPKPLSLKAQALAILFERSSDDSLLTVHFKDVDLLRRAIEQLPDTH